MWQTLLVAADPWDVLGLSRDAPIEEARRVWRLRAQLLHPDRYMDGTEEIQAEATRAMAALNDAWQQLQARYKQAVPPTSDAAPGPPAPHAESPHASETRPPPGRPSDGETTGPQPRQAHSEREDALGFILDAMRQIASFQSVPISHHEWAVLSSSMSEAAQDPQTSSLVDVCVRLLHKALAVDALDEGTVMIDSDVLLPKSWVECYEIFADEEDPPFAFVLLERAGQNLI